jgi:hypothetical protein
MSEPDARVRSAIHSYAESMKVVRPSVDMLLAVRQGPPPEPVSPLRTVVAVALTLVLLAGALFLVRRVPNGLGSPDSRVVEVARTDAAVVWPLTEDVVELSRLTTPIDAAEAYVRVALDLGSEWRWASGSGGGHVVEQRFVQEVEGEVLAGLRVWLTQLDGWWFVTGSAGDAGPVITDARIVDGAVRVEAVPAEGDVAGSDRLMLELVGTDGRVVDTTSARLQDGRWLVDVPVAANEQPVAVRALPEGGDAGARAEAVVLPDETNEHPVRDLFPAAIGGSYYAAWAETLAGRDSRRADWRSALQSYIERSGVGILSVPTFDKVVVGRNGHQRSGRFRTADGGSGTFEVARLQDGGPWFLISLRDDAVAVQDVRVMATEVEVTLDTGGEPRRYVEPFRPPGADAAVASFELALTGAGPVRRFYDAWAPEG